MANGIYIKEVLPNPAGKDALGEWIGLANRGGETVNLEGWIIKDASGRQFNLSQLPPEKRLLPPGQELKLGAPLTKISLNNDGDTLFLYNRQGEKVDEFNYSGPAGEDEIIGFGNQAPLAAVATNSEALIAPGPVKGGEATALKATSSLVNPFFFALLVAVAAALIAGLFVQKKLNQD
jgi:hypothetical protein